MVNVCDSVQTGSSQAQVEKGWQEGRWQNTAQTVLCKNASQIHPGPDIRPNPSQLPTFRWFSSEQSRTDMFQEVWAMGEFRIST